MTHCPAFHQIHIKFARPGFQRPTDTSSACGCQLIPHRTSRSGSSGCFVRLILRARPREATVSICVICTFQRINPRPENTGRGFTSGRKNYSSEGAPTGQVPAQAPQLMQVSASMTNLPSPSEMALTGHSAAQAPQLMQSSEILYAIEIHLHKSVCRFLYTLLL